MDWLSDERAAQLDKGRAPEHESPANRPRRGAVLVGLAALLLVPILWFLVGRDDPQSQQDGAASPGAPASPLAQQGTDPGPSTASVTPSASADITKPALTGAPLAHAWLRAYLTRPTGGEDTTWTQAVAPYSDPALVAALLEGEDLGTLGGWRTISVQAIRPAKLQHPPSTPTRQVSAWTVDLTDGTATAARTYTLTAYLDAEGHWTVAQVDPAYTSEG